MEKTTAAFVAEPASNQPAATPAAKKSPEEMRAALRAMEERCVGLQERAREDVHPHKHLLECNLFIVRASLKSFQNSTSRQMPINSALVQVPRPAGRLQEGG